MSPHDHMAFSTVYAIAMAIFFSPALLMGLVKIIEIAAWGVEGAADQNAYCKFMTDCRERGLDYRQSLDELRLREEMARLRREASDAVARGNIADWAKEKDRCVKEALRRLRTERPDLLPRFAAGLKGLPYTHIIYPAECKMIDKYEAKHAYRGIGIGMSDDQRAALRIVRPA